MSTVVLAELPGRACPIAASLELIGERWSLLIIRELALGNRRFSGIVEQTGAPRDRVAARLKALEHAGMVRRAAYQSAPPRFDYHLTESGRDLIPVLDALTAWGLDHAVEADDPDRPHFRRAPLAANREDTMTAELVETDTHADWGPAALTHRDLALAGARAPPRAWPCLALTTYAPWSTAISRNPRSPG